MKKNYEFCCEELKRTTACNDGLKRYERDDLYSDFIADLDGEDIILKEIKEGEITILHIARACEQKINFCPFCGSGIYC